MSTETNLRKPSTVDETITVIRRHSLALDEEHIPLEAAVGRVLREAVRADVDQPPFDRSAVDGFAIRLDDGRTVFRVVDRIRAGDWKPRELQPGEAVQIATGGALPGEDLQVVMKEDVRVNGDEVTVVERDQGRNIRFRGEDAGAGAELVKAGVRLEAGALALLASVGCARPRVSRLPVVLHLATGNEIVSPDRTPEQGQIRDSNSVLVRAFFEQWKLEPRQLRVPEEKEQAVAAIKDVLAMTPEIDLLLISGGASVGEHDFTRELLREQGYTIHVHRTTTRPGKPMIFGARGNTLAFGLPGNPLAHFVCLNLYVAQALAGFAGASARPEFMEGVLSGEFSGRANTRETLWPARLVIGGGAARLMVLRWQSSGDLTSLAEANALLRIPPGCGRLPEGAKVQFLPVAS